jgi:hypothetical protein
LAQEDSTFTSTLLVAAGAATGFAAGAGAAAEQPDEQLEEQPWLLILPRRPLPQPPNAKLSDAKTPATIAATAKTKVFFITNLRKKFITYPYGK